MDLARIAAVSVMLGALGSPALAADLPLVRKAAKAPAEITWWEIAYGGAIMSDYNFRGISQSDRGIAGTVYLEGRANIIPDKLQIYAGIQPYTTKLPTSPIGEFDFYAGIRPTLGPVQFDFGGIYYHYPRETQLFFADPTLTSLSPTNFGLGAFTVRDTDFWEVYGKANWTVNTTLSLGAYVYYSPNWLGTGAEATYAGGTVKLNAPSTWFAKDWGGYLSGELAHYWIGTLTALGAPFIDLPDYTYWNAGLAFTYKVLTLDLRYHDTDLTQNQCFVLTSDTRGLTNGGRSNWCSEAFIAKLSFDTTLK